MVCHCRSPYLDQRKLVAKPSTLTVYRQARIWLVRYVGESRRVDQISVTDADRYRAYMARNKLAKATIAKRCRYAREFFNVAIRQGLIQSNPFAHIKDAVKGNAGRRVFGPGDQLMKIVELVPDPQ
ncbi:MAG: phage integrase SAM-like domain-containing protein [Phycisphaerales bacterium]